VGVSGGADGLELCAGDGALELGEGFAGLAGLKEEKGEGEQKDWCDRARRHPSGID